MPVPRGDRSLKWKICKKSRLRHSARAAQAKVDSASAPRHKLGASNRAGQKVRLSCVELLQNVLSFLSVPVRWPELGEAIAKNLGEVNSGPVAGSLRAIMAARATRIRSS
jgi:hypothetical protein